MAEDAYTPFPRSKVTFRPPQPSQFTTLAPRLQTRCGNYYYAFAYHSVPRMARLPQPIRVVNSYGSHAGHRNSSQSAFSARTQMFNALNTSCLHSCVRRKKLILSITSHNFVGKSSGTPCPIKIKCKSSKIRSVLLRRSVVSEVVHSQLEHHRHLRQVSNVFLSMAARQLKLRLGRFWGHRALAALYCWRAWMRLDSHFVGAFSAVQKSVQNR